MIAQRSRLLAAAAFAAAALALVGCSASEENAGANQGTQYSGGAGKPGADQQGAGEEGAGQPGNAAPGQYRREDRAIVYTGNLTVRVDDVDLAAARASALADTAGGFVAGDERSSDAEKSQAHLTLRVPADRFIGTLDGLAELGDEESRQITTEDVTQQVVDLDAQIASQQASVARTRELLARAQSISEIVSIEAELAKRESSLGTLAARKQRLSDLTSLSTVTVHLLGPEATGPDPSFLAGLLAGWYAFVKTVTVVLAIAGFLLPFLVVFAVPAVLIWWRIRRRHAAVNAEGA